ncbi:MAG: glycosyltransferase family 4 protein [Verrucomicrobiota bacterium]
MAVLYAYHDTHPALVYAGAFLGGFRSVGHLTHNTMTENSDRRLRVLYSFPHKIGAGGICYAAWQHVKHLHEAGADVTVFPGVLHKPLPSEISVQPTLSRGRLRIPYKLLGKMRACRLHDWIVARRLRRMAGEFDLVHCFALGSFETLRAARELGLPTVLERCNAHTGFAYEVVARECERIGIQMPDGHPHVFNAEYLRREEAEYNLADALFCPSEFVARTFVDRGFLPAKLARFQYGFDESACYPTADRVESRTGLTVLFAGGCAPRKGLHYALDAWLQSSACHDGTFLVVGEFIPGYAEKLCTQLAHPSVRRLGFRKDLADVMRTSDVLVLPSIEEGSALVTYDARGCGCVLLVSDSTGAVCEHEHDALVHRTGDVETLANHFNRVHEDRSLLSRLRTASLETADELTWTAAGRQMLVSYRNVVSRHQTVVGAQFPAA